jgi:hypothetical protein
MSVVYDTPYNRAIRQKLLDIDKAYIEHSRAARVGTQEILTRDPLIKGGRLRTVFKALSGGSAVIDPEYVASLTGEGAEMVDKSKLSGGYMGEAVRPPVPDMYISGDDPRFEGLGKQQEGAGIFGTIGSVVDGLGGLIGLGSRQIGGALEEKEEHLAEDRAKGIKPRVMMKRGGANLAGVPTPAHLMGSANIKGVPTPAHLPQGGKKMVEMKPAAFAKEHKKLVGLLGKTSAKLGKEAKEQASEAKSVMKKLKGGDLADAMAVPRTPLTGYGEDKMTGGFMQFLLPMLPSIIGAITGKGKKASKSQMMKLEQAGLHQKLMGKGILDSLLPLAPLILGLGKKKRLTKADMQKLEGSGIFGTIGSVVDGLGGLIGLGRKGAEPMTVSAMGMSGGAIIPRGLYGRRLDDPLYGFSTGIVGMGKSAEPMTLSAMGMSGGAMSSAALSNGLIEKSQMPSIIGGSSHCDMDAAGMSGGGKRAARAALVKKIMQQKKLSLIEASKYVKEHGLKY